MAIGFQTHRFYFLSKLKAMTTIEIQDTPELVILVQRLQKTLKDTGKVFIGELENKKRIDFRTVYTFKDGTVCADDNDYYYSIK